jgi:hypothetical protein
MKKIYTALLVYSALLAGTCLSQAQLVAFWDFNDEATGYTNTPLSYVPDAGSQSGTASLDMLLADTGSSQTYGVRAEGTELNDINVPATAGNSFSFSRGWRCDGATATISFDASSISTAVELSFAINRINSNAVDVYQASYSTDGGGSFTDVGSLVPISVGEWLVNTIDFGTSLAGASNAMVRLTFDGGDTNWSTDHRTNIDNVALVAAVPEPASFALLLGFAVGVFLLRRRSQA